MHKPTLLIVASILLILMSGLALEFWLKPPNATPSTPDDPLVTLPDHPRHLIPFSLVDQRGQEVTQEAFYHKILVVSFLFTSCSIVCPYVTDQMAQIQRQTSGETAVRLLSLSVDPTDDTVPVLAQYASKAGADPERWSFLTGRTDSVLHLIETSFLAHDTNSSFSSMPGNFANSQQIVLVDTNGQIVKYFDGLNLDAAHAVVQEIKKLRKSTP
jgi:protein SCO1/2